MPTSEVPTRLQRAGSLAATGARLAVKGLYHTADFAIRDVAPFALQGGAALVGGAGALMLGDGTLLAGGGFALADTAMRDRDRPVDELTNEMEDAAYADSRLERPALRSFQVTNGATASAAASAAEAHAAAQSAPPLDERRGSWRDTLVSTAGAAMPYMLPAGGTFSYLWNRLKQKSYQL